MNNITEALLQFIWQHQLFDVRKITHTTTGESLSIVKQGVLNTHQGPDFSFAQVIINNTKLVGNIELHLQSSDWLAHKHQHDAAYQNIILHVVLEHNKDILDTNGLPIATLQLKDIIDTELLQQHQQLMQSLQAIPCVQVIQQVPNIVIQQQLNKALLNRLLAKAQVIKELLVDTTNDWHEVAYIIIAKYFGGSLNGDAMQSLAVRLPIRLLAKHKHNAVQIEAMLYGVAGLLPTKPVHNYEKQLVQEYNFLQSKYHLQSMLPTRWKFMRTRPQNFPTIRIAQLAQLLITSNGLWQMILDKHNNCNELQQLFKVSASSYWDAHYTFNKPHADAIAKHTGNTIINSILINAIAPLLYNYGIYNTSQVHCDSALELLQQLPYEVNAITKKAANIFAATTHSAADSQALLQQYNAYCTNKQCLNCSIGYKLLKQSIN
jgi:hypothetical protein